MFIPALVAGVLISLNKTYLFNLALKLIHLTTIWLTISQIILAWLFVSLNADFEIVTKSAASWMSTWELIAASWTDRWGSYHLWTWFTWILTSLFFSKLKSNRETQPENHRFFLIFIWGSLLILFLLMGQRPYRLNEGITVLRGLSPSLISIWNILHPPIAFASYTGFYISWVIGAFLWLHKRPTKFKEDLLRIDLIVSRITWILLSLMLTLGMIWSHEVNWGGYWLWDPAQVLGVVLWLISSYKLHIFKRKKDRPMYIFLSLFGFPIVFFAAWIITSNILGGLHSYAASPVATLFLTLIFITLLPIPLGWMKNKWKIYSPVKVERETNTTRILGFNMGVISYNVLIMGNLLVIFMQIMNELLSLEYDYEIMFPIINGFGFLIIVAGLFIDYFDFKSLLKIDRIVLGAFTIIILSALSFLGYPFKDGAVQYFQFVFILLAYISLITLVISEIRKNAKSRNFRRAVSHIAMILVLITIIANGAGPATNTRENFPMGVEESVITDLNGINIKLLNIAQYVVDRGVYTDADLLITWKGREFMKTIRVIDQSNYPKFVQPVIINLPIDLELFITLAPSDPIRYFGPIITGINLIVEQYFMVYPLYFATILFVLLPFLPKKQYVENSFKAN